MTREHEDGCEERKAQVTLAQLYQQPPGGKNSSLKDIATTERYKNGGDWFHATQAVVLVCLVRKRERQWTEPTHLPVNRNE